MSGTDANMGGANGSFCARGDVRGKYQRPALTTSSWGVRSPEVAGPKRDGRVPARARPRFGVGSGDGWGTCGGVAFGPKDDILAAGVCFARGYDDCTAVRWRWLCSPLAERAGCVLSGRDAADVPTLPCPDAERHSPGRRQGSAGLSLGCPGSFAVMKLRKLCVSLRDRASSTSLPHAPPFGRAAGDVSAECHVLIGRADRRDAAAPFCFCRATDDRAAATIFVLPWRALNVLPRHPLGIKLSGAQCAV